MRMNVKVFSIQKDDEFVYENHLPRQVIINLLVLKHIWF